MSRQPRAAARGRFADPPARHRLGQDDVGQLWLEGDPGGQGRSKGNARASTAGRAVDGQSGRLDRGLPGIDEFTPCEPGCPGVARQNEPPALPREGGGSVIGLCNWHGPGVHVW
jgi:hypothetical protein